MSSRPRWKWREAEAVRRGSLCAARCAQAIRCPSSSVAGRAQRAHAAKPKGQGPEMDDLGGALFAPSLVADGTAPVPPLRSTRIAQTPLLSHTPLSPRAARDPVLRQAA